MRRRLSRYLGNQRAGRIFFAGEFVVLVLVVWSITYLLTGNGFGLDLAPHPMWIPVLLFSIQYGSSGGLLAAIAVSALLVFGTIFHVGTIGPEPADLAKLFARPVAWIIAALVLGSIVDRRQAMNLALRQRIKTNQQRQRRLAATARLLKDRNLLLQRAVTLGVTGAMEIETKSAHQSTKLGRYSDLAEAEVGALTTPQSTQDREIFRQTPQAATQIAIGATIVSEVCMVALFPEFPLYLAFELVMLTGLATWTHWRWKCGEEITLLVMLIVATAALGPIGALGIGLVSLAHTLPRTESRENLLERPGIEPSAMRTEASPYSGIDAPLSIEPIANVIENGDEAGIQAAIELLAQRYDRDFWPVLEKAIHSPDPSIRSHAAAVASELLPEFRGPTHAPGKT